MRGDSVDRYPEETLDGESDDGTMPGNVDRLREAVVGHRIVSTHERFLGTTGSLGGPRDDKELVITLDNGREVRLRDTDDCCAYTELEAFLLHPERVDHVIMGVGTTDGFEKWHIYADLGDVLELTVGWSAGNPFYYGYGFEIVVSDP